MLLAEDGRSVGRDRLQRFVPLDLNRPLSDVFRQEKHPALAHEGGDYPVGVKGVGRNPQNGLCRN